MQLINKQGQPVNTGDIARTHRGEIVIITGWQEPRHMGSSGRIYVVSTEGRKTHSEYFPAVCGMDWATETKTVHSAPKRD